MNCEDEDRLRQEMLAQSITKFYAPAPPQPSLVGVSVVKAEWINSDAWRGRLSDGRSLNGSAEQDYRILYSWIEGELDTYDFDPGDPEVKRITAECRKLLSLARRPDLLDFIG